MIKKYNFENLISTEDVDKVTIKVDELFDSDDWAKSVPHYQTWPDLFKYDQLFKFKYSFILSCYLYLNKEVDIVDIKSWCYMNFYSNFHRNSVKSKLDILWHSHSEDNTKKLSGIFYLSNPKDVDDYSSTGTFFRGCPNIVPQDFHWFIYPSYLMHRPGKIQSEQKRYILAADLYYE